MREIEERKAQGDAVEWYSPLFSKPDRIYASKVFTFTPDFTDYAAGDPEPVRGGTGYDPAVRLPDEVERTLPDYSIYPDFPAALGFLARGCIRKCPWYIVPEKEGALKVVGDIERIAAGRRDVVLLDNNFLAAPDDYIREQLTKAARMGIRLDFNQGLDARLMTAENARLLASCRWIRFIRFSCDTAAMIEPIRRAVADPGDRQPPRNFLLHARAGHRRRGNPPPGVGGTRSNAVRAAVPGFYRQRRHNEGTARFRPVRQHQRRQAVAEDEFQRILPLGGFEMSEEFKCPSCGGTASIAYYRAGNNLLYCHDCQKAFSEVGAKIMKQAARIAELEKMAEARKLANRLLEQERNELEAERDRLREALKEVLNCEVVTDTGDYSKGGTGFDCNEVKEIIRGALEGVRK